MVASRKTGARRTRNARRGTARGKLRASRARRSPRRRWQRARKTRGHGERTTEGDRATKRLPAENRAHGWRIGRAAWASVDVAAQRNRASGIVARPEHGARESRDVERRAAGLERRSHGNASRHRWRQVGPRRAETVCNKCARHGHRWTSRCSARAGAATSQATRPERGAGATRGVARRASGLERLECGIAPRRNWRRARLTRGHGARPGNEAFCRQCIGSKACELGPRHGHPWKSRRGAIVRAASPQGRSEARPKRAMWHGARPT